MMRKLWCLGGLAGAFLFLAPGRSCASVFDVWTDSFTGTNETGVIISSAAMLNSVCISSSSAAGGFLKIWNASGNNGNVVSTVTVVDTSRTQTGCYPYNVYVSSGLVYSTGGSTTPGDVEMLWSRFSH